jgi:hypothetical protein
MDAATIPPMCGRYASFLPAEAMARIFGTVRTGAPRVSGSAALRLALWLCLHGVDHLARQLDF